MDSFGNKIWDSLSQVTRTTLSTSNGSTPVNSSDSTTAQAGNIPKSTSMSDKRKSNSFFDEIFTLNNGTKENDKGSSPKSASTNNDNNTSNDASPNTQSASILNPLSSSNNSNTYSSQFADKFMERIISMAIPTTTTSSKRELESVLNRIEIQKTRPPLSIQTMSRNSILLLQRLTIPFELIDSIIRLFNWQNPTFTIMLALFLTLCLLKPINFITVPLFYICFEIIVPAYVAQNPGVDDEFRDADADVPKPVNEFSREFLLNVTDLQNHMLLYVISWNFINKWCGKLFYFKDEVFTLIIFFNCLMLGILLEYFGTFLIVTFLPVIKFLTILSIWALLIILHPKNRNYFFELIYSEDTRLKILSITNKLETIFLKELDFKDELKEVKQLEIYELQILDNETKNWQFICFTNEIYPPNSHFRLNQLPIDGTVTLNNITLPEGWIFINNEDNSLLSHSGNKRERSFLIDSEKSKIIKQKLNSKKKQRKLNKDKNRNKKKNRAKKIKKNNNTANDGNKINSKGKENLIGMKELNWLKLTTKLDGWFLDLCPDTWVSENYLDNILEIDEESKWVYDLVPRVGPTDFTNAGLSKVKKIRGEFRRRRWVRYCIRDMFDNLEDDDSANIQDENLTSTEDESGIGTEDETEEDELSKDKGNDKGNDKHEGKSNNNDKEKNKMTLAVSDTDNDIIESGDCAIDDSEEDTRPEDT